MSRKFDRKQRIVQASLEHVQDPMFMKLFFMKTFRARPVFVPKLVWKGLLRLVLTPAAWKTGSSSQ